MVSAPIQETFESLVKFQTVLFKAQGAIVFWSLSGGRIVRHTIYKSTILRRGSMVEVKICKNRHLNTRNFPFRISKFDFFS